MTLDELNALKKEADNFHWESCRAKELSDKLAGIRNGEKPLMVAYKELGNWNDRIKSAIEGIINECGHDLLRIVEMRHDAHARLKSEQAKQKLAVISAALGGSHDNK
ncbi:hypothetical protein [Allopusillimonas ginsengisoli]|uniref:hypothetical protein n=1 Tax=Allopusillimonas ginsengisoli TaxID=453575 RepID=UPI00102107F6|nr:hypothetical protein [Allopusillimonas ginsengisoli]TEA78678.1 hypothetical protein ERE07_09800 [Allopusillimonas ginsengisoli]